MRSRCFRARSRWSVVGVTRRTLFVSAVAGVVALAGLLVYLESSDDSPPKAFRYPVAWTLNGGFMPGPASRSVVLELHDRHCADGVRAADRLRPAKIVYGTKTVTITLTAELNGGAHNCLGTPPSNTTIHLAEPLGTRTLVDGSGLRP